MSSSPGRTGAGRTVDVVEIQQLAARYAHYLDQGRAEETAALFTDGAVWDGSASGLPIRTGREAIHEGFAQGGHRYLHLVTSHLVDFVDDDHATGTEYMIATTTSDDGVTHLAVTRLDDRYERTADGWRFSARALVPMQSARWSPDETRFNSPANLPPT